MKRICVLFVILLLGLGGVCLKCYGAESGTLSIQQVQEKDVIEIYRMASYDGSGFVWEASVSEWLAGDGSRYASIEPQELSEMLSARAQEFCELLLLGLRDEQSGAVKLDTVKQTGKSSYTLQLEPGYYMLLPKGDTRIYQLDWFCIASGQNVAYSYGSDTYSLPKLQAEINNLTEDRGCDADGIPWTIANDVLRLVCSVQTPDYPGFYTDGKLVSTISIVIPKGFLAEETGYGLTGVAGGAEKALTEHGEYVCQKFEQATVCYEPEGEPLFLESTGGWFYTMGGESLAHGERADAVTAYNAANGTSYEEDMLSADENQQILIFSVVTEESLQSLKLQLTLQKDSRTNETGSYRFPVTYIYSTSAVETDKRGMLMQAVAACSLGVRITVCDGDSFDSSEAVTAIPEEALRLSGASFHIYELNGFYDLTEGSAALERDKALLPEEGSYVMYGQDGTTAKLYSLMAAYTTDEQGEISVGGLEKKEYLLRETDYPYGYSLSRSALIIAEGDWEDSSIMEGNYLCDTLWLNYGSGILPQTGGSGIRAYWCVGLGFICLSVGGLLLINKRGRKLYEDNNSR